jgi:hypothetical protein
MRLLMFSGWAANSGAKSPRVLSVKIHRKRPRIMLKMAHTTAM